MGIYKCFVGFNSILFYISALTYIKNELHAFVNVISESIHGIFLLITLNLSSAFTVSIYSNLSPQGFIFSDS